MEKSDVQKLLENLKKRNYTARYFENAAQAAAAVLEEIQPDESVGIGGSMTIHGMGLHNILIEKGHEVFWHWLVPPSERDAVRKKAANADLYLSSTNAVTVQGDLVNIDGSGNRVSSMFFGPDKVIIICGINKITEDYESAVERVKNVACPANARRLKLSTPCAVTGKCSDCSSKDRMCNIMVKMERVPVGKDIRVFLVGEALGY